MNLQPRDRRAISYLALALVIGLAIRFWPEGSSVPVVAAVADPVALAEKKLAKLREAAATVQSKEAILKNVSANLAEREKAILQVETVPQAQAQLLQIFRRITSSENPQVEIRGSEFGSVRPMGDKYAEVAASAQLECKIDQLVNILASISQQPELISLTDVRITSSSPKEKTVGVRLTISAVVPNRVIPAKGKGGATF